RTVFHDTLNFVSGIEIGYGGVWVGAAPQMLFIPDRDRDDKPDGPPEVILDGFDTRDTHETPNSFMWGNDGWLYGCQGVFNSSKVGKPGTPDDQRITMRAGIWRLHPKTHAFEIYAHGGSNQWGLDYDAEGNMLMTHCRSSWGEGPVSQVIRDGHYWTQNNSAHHPFIAAGTKGWSRSDSSLLNFLNGIAAYGHGEGGAGGPGSKAVFGGHSHVGSMVYLGDNWPAEYRGQLYTNNLHGAQMNRLFLSPLDAGLLAHTHGRDQLLIKNPQYLAVDLKYGPDGAVYIIDWADKQHCHTNNADAWDRSSGALYRLKYASDFKPAPKLDLFVASEDELLGYLSHDNEWYARMAQHVIRQRDPSAKLQDAIRERLFEGSQRFRHVVALHASGGLRKADTDRLLADSAESIRAQTLHYLTESDASAYADRFAEIARTDDSARVRLALAGACQHRLSAEIAKPILEILAGRSEDRNDRFIPKMIWYAYSKYPEADIKALKTEMPLLRQSIAWRTGETEEVAAPPQQTQLQRGKASFLICSACHKPGLQLPGPALEDILGAYNDKAQLIAWMKKPVKKRPNYPEMPPFDKMDPQTLDDIATYLLSLRPAGVVQLTFENGNIDGWTTEGEAFKGQPIKGDTVSGRPHTPGDSIDPVGDYWIGSYERHQDAAQGRMTSGPISVISPKASFMVGGGKHPETRVEIVDLASGTIIHTARGRNRETLHRETLDLSALVGGTIQIRLIDEHSGGWGHINFDDFRFEGRRIVGDLAADFTRGQLGKSNTHPNWRFHSDTDANPANGGLALLTWAKTGTEGNSGFAGTGTIFKSKDLGPLPSISDLGLYDRVKAAPTGMLAAHPGQASGAPEYLVIEFRADSNLRGLQLDYRIDNPSSGGDGIDWHIQAADGKALLTGSLNGEASHNPAAAIPELDAGQSLWLVIGNGFADNPGADQTFLRLRLTAQ
ncbi:MAG: putative membrane-bound dehydrogenase-like protein, partial [Rhodothermales bacterium]